MISRMILVGLVAVLGVSLPSQSESGRWLTSAHDWAIAQLAEWDTSAPGEDGCLLVDEASNPLPREAIQAPARTNTTVSVAFDPMPVADDLDILLAYELNGMAEGLDIPATTTAVAESPTDFAAVSPGDSIELKLAVELCRIAEASACNETPASPAIPRPREAGADPAIDEIFADVSRVFAPPEQGPGTIARTEPISIVARPIVETPATPAIPRPREAGADPAIDEIFADVSRVFAPPEQGPGTIAQPEPTPIAAEPMIELIQPLVDLETDIATELNRFAEGIAIRLENALPRSVRIRTFEPIKVPADLESGTAYELNRASEGRETVLPEVRKPSDARPPIPASATTANVQDKPDHEDASIGKALGLTRDAALAWMNVLTGTTPVMMTSQ